MGISTGVLGHMENNSLHAKLRTLRKKLTRLRASSVDKKLGVRLHNCDHAIRKVKDYFDALDERKKAETCIANITQLLESNPDNDSLKAETEKLSKLYGCVRFDSAPGFNPDREQKKQWREWVKTVNDTIKSAGKVLGLESQFSSNDLHGLDGPRRRLAMCSLCDDHDAPSDVFAVAPFLLVLILMYFIFRRSAKAFNRI